jgi:hypothetical protein
VFLGLVWGYLCVFRRLRLDSCSKYTKVHSKCTISILAWLDNVHVFLFVVLCGSVLLLYVRCNEKIFAAEEFHKLRAFVESKSSLLEACMGCNSQLCAAARQ